jgi:hypothetical protein
MALRNLGNHISQRKQAEAEAVAERQRRERKLVANPGWSGRTKLNAKRGNENCKTFR